jgi:hypothetical protein
MPKETQPLTNEDRLDLILHHLEALDRRDRLRTQAAFVRGLLGLIPLIIFVWSAWFFVNNYQQILSEVTKQAATAAAEATKNGSQGALDALLEKYGLSGSSSSSSAPRR